MRILLLSILVSLTLFAQNPKAFSALGDVIYNNVDKIKKLENIADYDVFKDEIQKYVNDVSKIKKDGFLLDKRVIQDKMKYLQMLRKLSKTNDFFVKSVNRNLQVAIDNNNSKLFSQLLETRLVDEKKYKKQIVDYYLRHKKEIKINTLIQRCMENNKTKRVKEAYKKRLLMMKKQRELEKIKRIREQDRLEQERLERELNQEVKKKKEQIREEQKKELSNTI